jgi:prolyl oligopeptidase PreP (S9A serine peptidase family)
MLFAYGAHQIAMTPIFRPAWRSHGGLLVSAVLTQRPGLAAVALPMVGIMDMLRYSYKFTAALQHASAGSRPALLRTDPATGHGGTGAASKPRAALVAETADLLAFAATHTGLVPATHGAC